MFLKYTLIFQMKLKIHLHSSTLEYDFWTLQSKCCNQKKNDFSICKNLRLQHFDCNVQNVDESSASEEWKHYAYEI